MESLYRATLTYRDPVRTEAIIAPLPDGITRPPQTLRRPTVVPGMLEVFELVDDEDWDEHRLAGYVFVGTVEREESPDPTP